VKDAGGRFGRRSGASGRDRGAGGRTPVKDAGERFGDCTDRLQRERGWVRSALGGNEISFPPPTSFDGKKKIEKKGFPRKLL
jgi:hypothetical protein